MYKFRFDYVKLKHGENAKLCYMDTDRFIVYIKQTTYTQTKDVETKFDFSNCQPNHYQKEKNKKVIELMKGELS